jgi:hypothetical protein
MSDKKRFMYHITLYGGVMLSLLFCLLLYPVGKQYAYQFCTNDCFNKGVWIYDRSYHNTAPVDVAFIGSSRTSLGIMETALEDSLKKLHVNMSIANMGYCRWGRNMDYATAKILFAHKQPRCIVLELHEEEERLGHVDFGYIADTKDVLMPVLVFNQHFFSDVYKALVVRFDFLKHTILNDQPPAPIDHDVHGYIHFNGSIDPQELAKRLEEERGRKHYEDTKIEKLINKQYPLAYLQKMIALAVANNCKVVFLYIPGYCSLPPNPGEFDYYQRYGPVLSVPSAILKQPQNWRDADHFNDSGALKLSSWLAGALKPII